MDQTGQSSAYRCEICNKVFHFNNNLKKHLKVHDGDYKYKCKVCTIYFKTKENLKAHSVAKHAEAHLCVTCGKTFTRRSALNDHCLGHSDATLHQSPSKRLYLCPFENCKKKFVRKTKYEDHLHVHSNLKPYTCYNCDKQFSGRYRLNFHKRVCAGDLKFFCDICNAELADPNVLRRHKEGTHGVKTYVCSCGKLFKFYSSLYKHKKKQNH